MTTFTTDIILGDEYTDTVTGYKGKAVAVDFNLTGCTRVVLQAKTTKDGSWVDAIEVDTSRCLDSKGKQMDKPFVPPLPEQRGGPARRVKGAR